MVTTLEGYYSQIKIHLASQGIEGLCLDVDDTLSATNLFWAENHIVNFGNPEQLTAEEIVKRYRYASNVPYWGNNETAERWIAQNCESVDGRCEVLPIDGARGGVRKIEEVTTLIAYLTGRIQPTTEGTKRWLAKHGFPMLDILAQPPKETLEEMSLSNGNEWKARVLEYMYPYVKGIVDDNAGLVAELSPDYSGTVYLFSHSKPIKTPLDVIYCQTWADVVREVKTREEYH